MIGESVLNNSRPLPPSQRAGRGGDFYIGAAAFPLKSHLMSISRDVVEKVSLLARLQLTDDELDAMTSQLDQIVGYVDQLGEVDTDDVAPMAHAIELTNVLVDDEVADSLPREQALANAPHHNEECYLVPPVLGE